MDADGSIIEVALSTFNINTVAERTAASAHMVRWGGGLGHALKNLELEMAALKKWRAEATAKALEDNPKLAEWRAKMAVDALPEFTMMTERVGYAKQLVAATQAAYEASRMKAGTLKAMTEREPGDRAAAGEATTIEDESEADKRVDKMHAMFEKRSSDSSNGKHEDDETGEDAD